MKKTEFTKCEYFYYRNRQPAGAFRIGYCSVTAQPCAAAIHYWPPEKGKPMCPKKIEPTTEPQPPADRPPRKSIKKVVFKKGKPVFQNILQKEAENNVT